MINSKDVNTWQKAHSTINFSIAHTEILHEGYGNA